MAVREFNAATTFEYVACFGAGTGAFAAGSGGVGYSIGAVVKPLSLVSGATFIAFHTGAVPASPSSVIAAMADGGGGVLSLFTSVTAAGANVGLTAGDWQYIGLDKPAGTVAPRLHRRLLGSGSWSHVTSSTAAANEPASCNNVEFGALLNGGFSSSRDMRAAFFFLIPSALSDANHEAIEAALASSAIGGFSPLGAWELNQASVAVAVTDFTGNGSDQFLRSGTSVITGDDPTWAFGAAAAPSSLVSPSLSGLAQTDEVLTCDPGVWAGSPIPTITYQWKRADFLLGFSPISGETSATYTAAAADENLQVKCTVTATNTLGAVSVDTAPVLVLPPPPVNIQPRLSGGASNANPLTSIGGVKSSELVPAGLFDDVPRAEADPGEAEYRLIYAHNADTTGAVVKAWVPVTPSPIVFAVGVATQAVDATVPAVADENTAPAGVTFSAPATAGAAVTVATLNAGQHKGLWIRRTVPAACGDAVSNDATIRLEVTPL